MTDNLVRKRGGRPSTEHPHPVDIHVGSRVRIQRQALGLSQDGLGKELGLTFQQVQKYERGMNRVSASRLFELAKVLSVTTDFFYQGLDANQKPGFAESGQDEFTIDTALNRETIELVRAYSLIRDPKVKRQALEMVKTFATTAEPKSPAE